MENFDMTTVERTMKALADNRMTPYYAATAADALELVKELCPAGSSVSCGGSVTLSQIGFDAFAAGGQVRFINRFDRTADLDELTRAVATCDVFLTSANAITESGELYNVDGNGNRVSALICGPKSVVVVAGFNKIVPDLAAARERVRNIAAPKNAARLNKKTPCVSVGHCCDCRSLERICCHTVVSAYQRFDGRIKVVIVGESLGY